MEVGRADWCKFEERCAQDITVDVLREHSPIDSFTEILPESLYHRLPQILGDQASHGLMQNVKMLLVIERNDWQLILKISRRRT